MSRKNKENKSLPSTDLVETVVGEVIGDSSEDRQVKCILLWMLGKSPLEAAKLCGYHPAYGYKVVRMYRENQNLRARVAQIAGTYEDRYLATARLRLAEIAGIEAGALKRYKENEQLAIDKPQLLKHLKQAAGVLNDDRPGPQTIIQVNNLRELMVGINQKINERPE
ncbi:MAG: hypothetical protein JSW39_22760 [Desulfobacterales bacterium]|nr:MAG: hypothetical protein JSW39_22760 [Desulfobacterales bacterium]